MLIVLSCLCLTEARAQGDPVYREIYCTWEDFVEDYFSEDKVYSEWTEEYSENYERFREQELERLESISHSPINLNTATRHELLRLPFLSPSQADSLLAYRERHKRFYTLGELQFVRGVPYETRRYLSLFVYAGDTLRAKPTARQMLRTGKHEVVVRTDIPLYERAGFQSHTPQDFAASPNKYYQGGKVAHSLRYRYTFRDKAAFGFNLQQDSGEPFGCGKNHPYDYTSAHLYLHPHSRLRLWLGDYELSWGAGLLVGNAFYASRLQAVTSPSRQSTRLRPHTGMSESGFFRGAAASFRFHRDWEVTAFASFRREDARTRNDTVTSFRTDGMHRTLNDIASQRAVGVVSVGGRVSRQLLLGEVGANIYYTRYDKVIWPKLHEYNRYYLRGREAAGGSVDVVLSAGDWHYRAELAFDRFGHPATTHLLQYAPRSALMLTLQGRYFSPQFVAPFAQTLQAGTHTQNEAGLLPGLTWTPDSRFTLTAYADFFRFRRPVYRADRTSQGLATAVQGKYCPGESFSHILRYCWSTRQQNVTGHPDLMQYIGTHACRYALSFTSARFNCHVAVDFRVATQQVKSPSYGRMLSLRAGYTPSPVFRLQGFFALFHSDDYSSRLYAYEPQLRYGSNFPNFAYKGLRGILQAQWQVCSFAGIAVRYGILHYFDRDSIGSGTERIASSTKQDISVQAIFKFGGKR